MFKVAQRYIAYNFLPPFLASCIFFVMFLLTFQLFKITRILINKGVEFSVILELIGHIAISFFPMAIPLSALVATIYTFNKLCEDSEIMAMRSFGMSKFQLFQPLLILGILISLVVFSLNMNIIPFSKKQFKNQIIKLTSRGMITDIKTGHFFTDIPNVTLFAENVEKKGELLKNVFIHIKDRNKKSERVIFAKKGVLIRSKSSDWEVASLRLHLSDGNIIKTFNEKNDIEKILYKEYEFPLVSVGETPGFVTKDSMRTSYELFRIIFPGNEKIRKGVKILRAKLEFWARLNAPLQCLLFILLGFCFGIQKGRGKSKNTSAMAMLILTAYYILFFAGVSFAKKGLIPPSATIFVPTFLLASISLHFYRKLDWVN